MLTKIAIAAAALLISVSAADAGEKHKPRYKSPPNYNGEHHRKKHRGDGHNYWRGGHNNYWRGGHNNYWRGGNNNNYFYQDPNFWGGVAGGLIGGAIIREYDYDNVPPPAVYQQPAECFMAWTQVYIPGKGFVPYQTTVCP